MNYDDRHDSQIENQNFKSFVGHTVRTIIAEQDTYEFLVVKMTTSTDKKKKKTGLINKLEYLTKDKEPEQASLQAKIKMRFKLPLPKDKK